MLHQIASSQSASLFSVISYAWIDSLIYKMTPPPLLSRQRHRSLFPRTGFSNTLKLVQMCLKIESMSVYRRVRVSSRPCIVASVYRRVRVSSRPCIVASVYRRVRVSSRPCIVVSVYRRVHVSSCPCIVMSVYHRVHLSSCPCIVMSMYRHVHVSSCQAVFYVLTIYSLSRSCLHNLRIPVWPQQSVSVSF